MRDRYGAAGALLGLAALAEPAAAHEPGAAAPARDMVERYYSQFQKPGFEVDALMEFYADDVAFRDPTFEIIANGKAEVRALYADIGTERTNYKDIVWSIENVIAQNDMVAINGKWAGVFFTCPFEVEFTTLWRLANGQIVEQKDFFAASAFDRQVNWNPETRRADCVAAGSQ